MPQTRIIGIDPKQPAPEAIQEAGEILKGGGIVALPTETVYGLAVMINLPEAVARLRALKQRPAEKNFSVCVHDITQVERYAEQVSPLAYRVMAACWPGPLTLILPAGGTGTIGLRIPDHPVALAVLRYLSIPIFLPSANRNGAEPARSAPEVLNYFDGEIDAVVDAGPAVLGVPSTVCRIQGNDLSVLRQGAVSEEELVRIQERQRILIVCTGNSCRSPMAEGLLRQMVPEHIEISSAGMAAMDGAAVSENACAALEQFGVDIRSHRVKLLREDMIRNADLVLVMEEAHRQSIVSRMPDAAERVFLLSDYASNGQCHEDIIDPIGQGLPVYMEVAQTLKKYLERVVERLL